MNKAMCLDEVSTGSGSDLVREGPGRYRSLY